MADIVLFTKTFPYGVGETFLEDELPQLSNAFDRIIIYPLYIPEGSVGNGYSRDGELAPYNLELRAPLLPFDYKRRKWKLFVKGMFNTVWVNGFAGELFCKGFLSLKNFRGFWQNTLLLRTILSNRKALRTIRADLDSVAYFYWGDRSTMILPYLKDYISEGSTKFVVRFHAGDLYEEKKGYLPYRKQIFSTLDYAVAISSNGEKYIRERYSKWLRSADAIKLFPLGSINPIPNLNMQHTNKFSIMSCCKVTQVKRVEMIAQALQILGKNMSTLIELSSQSMRTIEWVHFGGGPLLEKVKAECAGLPSYIKVKFMGQQPHATVIDYYLHNRVDLLVQASSSEGVPVSIMEAMSFGTPVVATDVGGVNEIVNSSNGTLLNKDITAKQLADAIYVYLNMDIPHLDIMRKAAFDTWQEGWNGTKNYIAFTNFLKEL